MSTIAFIKTSHNNAAGFHYIDDVTSSLKLYQCTFTDDYDTNECDTEIIDVGITNVVKLWHCNNKYTYVLQRDGSLYINTNGPGNSASDFTKKAVLEPGSKLWTFQSSNIPNFLVVKPDGTAWVLGDKSETTGVLKYFGMNSQITDELVQITNIEPHSIRDVWAYGYGTTIFISMTNGRVYAVGDGSCALGIGDNYKASTLTRTDLPNNIVKMIIHKDSYALSSTGQLFVAKYTGIPTTPDQIRAYYSSFEPINFGSEFNIIDIWLVVNEYFNATIYILTSDYKLMFIESDEIEIDMPDPLDYIGETYHILHDFRNITNITHMPDGAGVGLVFYTTTDGKIYRVASATDDSRNIVCNTDINVRFFEESPIGTIRIIRDSSPNISTEYNTITTTTHPAISSSRSAELPNTYTFTINKESELINTLTLLNGKLLTQLNSIEYKYSGEIANDVGGVSRQVFTKICNQLTDLFFTRVTPESEHFVISNNIALRPHSATIGSILAYYLLKEYSIGMRLSNIILSMLLDKKYNITEISALETSKLYTQTMRFSLDMLLETNAQLYLDQYINSIPSSLHPNFILSLPDVDSKTFYDIVQEILSATGSDARRSIYNTYKTQLNSLFNKPKFLETYMLCQYCVYDKDGSENINLTEFVRGFTQVINSRDLVGINDRLINKRLEVERRDNPTWLPEYFTELQETLNDNNIGLSQYIEGNTLTPDFILRRIVISGRKTDDNFSDNISKFIVSLSSDRLVQLVYLWTGLRTISATTKLVINVTKGDLSRLPVAHTCFYTLDLSYYRDYKTLDARLNTFIDSGDTMALAGGGTPNIYIHNIRNGINVHRNRIKLELFILNRIY